MSYLPVRQRDRANSGRSANPIDRFHGAPKVCPPQTMDDPLPRDQMRAEAQRLADIFTAVRRSFVMKLSTDLARGNRSFPNYFVMGSLCREKQLSMTEIAQKMGQLNAEEQKSWVGIYQKIHTSCQNT